MKVWQILLLLFLLNAGVANAQSMSYEDGQRLYQQSQQNPGFKQFVIAFLNFSNNNGLDTKNGCYKLASGEVNLIFVVNRNGIVESVLSDVSNSKSDCFRRTYLGLRVQAPPSAPFAFSMKMK
jgi:hypothetical protein